MRLKPGSTLIALLAASLTIEAWNPSVLLNSFNSDREGWQAYDYNGGIAGGGNVFYPLNWVPSGGVNNSGHVWADDSQWRIDTPENPNSILAFIIYRSWIKAPALDLRDAEVSVFLRGDGLDLKGGQCYFWALDHEIGTRWHYTAQPLTVTQGKWGKPLEFRLKNQESRWHRSWARTPSRPASLDEVLRSCDSYGFSFLNFSEEVTGRLSMDELRISLRSTSGQ
jgi:hypothetical protein